MRDYVTEFPYLNNLIGGYFNEDWILDGATGDEVVDVYCRTERLENRRGAVSDIERLLHVAETEDQLREALAQMGCAYRINGAEESVRGWLHHVRGLVDSSLEQED